MQKGVPGIFAFLLAVYWLVYLRGARTSRFADSTRYLDPDSGWSLLAALDRHQGAFFPVVLFQTAATPSGVFIVNSVAWLLSWTLLCAAVARRLTPRAGCAVSAALLVVATTSQVVGWHGAVLTESLAVSIAVLTIAAIVFESASARTPWSSVASFVLLLLTKPLLALALFPVVAIVIYRSVLPMPARAPLLALLAAGLVLIPTYATTEPYGEGLTFKGWYALTRAVRFSTEPALAAATTLPIRSCAPLSAGIDASVARGYELGLVPELTEALRHCPEQVRWLNRDAPGPLSLLVREPVAAVHAIVSGLEWLAKPMVYPSFLLGLGTWGEGAIHRWLTPREPGPYLGIIFVILCACSVRGRPAFGIACVPLLAGVIAVGAFAMFVDAIEQGRHASPFNVLSLTTTVLMLPSASSLRENQRV